MSSPVTFLLIATLATAACTDDPVTPGPGDGAITPAPDARPADAAPRDASSTDARPAVDAAPDDAGPPSPDAEPPPADSGADAGAALPDASPAVDVGPYDGGAICEFLDLEIAIVRCGNTHAYLRNFQDVNGTAGCLPYWTLQGGTYTSSAAAVAGAGCSGQCYYRASTSVSFVDHCGRRNGYIVFRDPDPAACPALYEFSSGLFPSREAWERDTPCPDAGP